MGSEDESSREPSVELPTNSDGVLSTERGGSLMTGSGEHVGENSRELFREPRSYAVDGEYADESSTGETKNFDGISMGKDEPLMENSGCDTSGACESSVEGRIDEVGGQRDSLTDSIDPPVDHRPGAGSPSPDHPVTKGKGLRKWRRRRREAPKEGGSGLDLRRALKRGLSNIDPALNGHTQVESIDNRHRKEGLLAPLDSKIHSGVVTSSPNCGTTFQIHNQDPLSATQNALLAGEEVINSEDQGSRSSTAASLPRIHHDVDVQIDHIEVEKIEENDFVFSSEPLTMQKNFDDGSKKSRTQKLRDVCGESDEEGIQLEDGDSSKIGEQVIHHGDVLAHAESKSVERGNSPAESLFSKHGSSCSNGQWIQGQTNNWCFDCDGEVSQFECRSVAEALQGLERTLDDAHTNWHQENGVETENKSSGNGSFSTLGSNAQINRLDHRKIENMEAVEISTKPMNQNHSPHKERDAWRESVAQLQAAQDALEKEILKIRAIGQATSLLPGIPGNSSGSTVEHDYGGMQLENMEGNGVLSVEFLPTVLHHRVIHLESKLKEADFVIVQKEQKLKEFETFIAQTNSQERENELRNQMNDLETEIGSLFKDKVEAEVKYFIVNEMIKNLKYSVADEHSGRSEGHESLLAEQSQMLIKLKEAERHSLVLKSRSEELVAACTILSGTEEVLKMQNDVHKLSFFCFIQLIVLSIAIFFSFSQLWQDAPGVVPT